MATLIDIKDLLSNIANTHSQINDFVFDNIDVILSKKDVKYAAMFVTPLSINVGKKYNEYVLQMVIIDKLTKDDDNYLYVLENTRQIMLDVLAEIDRNSFATLQFDTQSVTLTDVKDTWNDDNIAGWIVNINCRVPNELGTCGIPYILPPGVVLQENGFPLLLEN